MIKYLTTILLCAISSLAFGLSNDAKVPVLLYHSWAIDAPCDYTNSNQAALAADLETLHQRGFTVVPVYWLVMWSDGLIDGSELPDKVVGLTFDDGHDSDWLDNTLPDHECAPIPSFRTIMEDFKKKYAEELPWYSPHAATFVIASKEARDRIHPHHMNDNWWSSAQSSDIMEIYNHSADHDHTNVIEPTYDDALGATLPAAGHSDGEWYGQLRPDRIDNYEGSNIHVALANQFIFSKTLVGPDLFAHPLGMVSDYTLYEYFPNYRAEHLTYGAFCTAPSRGAADENYLTRNSNRYCMPRLTFGYNWTTPDGFMAVLRNSN